MASKSDLRLSIRNTLRSIEPTWSATAARSLASFLGILLHHAAESAPHQVLSFWPSLPGEPDIRPLLSALSKSLSLYFPRSGETRIDFVQNEGDPGTFMSIPKKGAAEAPPGGHVWSPDDASTALVLVPGLAFSRSGSRLGRGAGWFDRFLADHPNLVRIGICWKMQVLAAVPEEPHDERMNWVCTEDGFFRCSARAAHV